VELVLRDRYRMRELHIGYDHGFGRHRAGNVEVLQQLGKRDGFGVEVIGPVSTGAGQPVSSTSIRRSVAGGDLERAEKGLGRPYSLQGMVVRGAGRGKALGFATLNLSGISSRKLLPPEGVYSVKVQTPVGAFGGMMNIGPRPTFGDMTTTLEAHLFDAAGDFYDAIVRVDFVSFIRATRKFSSPDELMAQLRKDEELARRSIAQD
jgi:riboflavin kinase/FMN adenylyltransferase